MAAGGEKRGEAERSPPRPPRPAEARACPWKAETAAGRVRSRRGAVAGAMSGGFELRPRDGGPRVALAPGETVIGRGPLLRVSAGPAWLP